MLGFGAVVANMGHHALPLPLVVVVVVVVLLLPLNGGRGLQVPSPAERLSVDWPAFLARADMVWAWGHGAHAPPPDGWWEMAFTGDGMLGAMITAGTPASNSKSNSSLIRGVDSGDLGSLQIELGREWTSAQARLVTARASDYRPTTASQLLSLASEPQLVSHCLPCLPWPHACLHVVMATAPVVS